jgi:8-oxo-dGTP diphosphatase
LITREGPGGPEVVLVHRPAYDDWSFPKGKLEQGEDELACATREVEEETGLACLPTTDLGVVTYVDGQGRLKVVRYWRMVPERGAEPLGQHEVDDARWMPIDAAASTLTHRHDRRLLDRLVGAPATGTNVAIHVLRHAIAVDAGGWQGPDDRPLSLAGQAQARALVERLAGANLTRIISSPAHRCVQTLEPLAEALGLPIETAQELRESQPAAGGEAWVLAVATEGPAVLCTHGDVLQGVVHRAIRAGAEVGEGDATFDPAALWRMDVQDGSIRRVTPPPAGG